MYMPGGALLRGKMDLTASRRRATTASLQDALTVHDPVLRPRRPLPPKLPRRAWALAIGTFVCAYGFLFTVVHPYVDTRRCVARLPDPFFVWIPFHDAWSMVTHDFFYVVTAAVMVKLLVQVARGEHRPLVRFGFGISLQAVFRALTMWLLPLCRDNVQPGTPAIIDVDSLNLGFARIPWRSWATNDLMFSGHVAEFLVLSLAVRGTWPRSAQIALAVFQILQAFALVATRGHYAIDIVVAVPFAIVSAQLADVILRRLLPGTRQPTAPTA